jgi:RNA recognition motif-containing protein
LKSGVTEDDIRNVFGEFLDKILSVRIMKGKMRGQAFVDVVDEESAENILNQCSGIILKNKPVIIQFGKSK